MAFPVYSIWFYCANITPPGVVDLPLTAGFRYVIRDIDAHFINITVPDPVSVSIEIDGGPFIYLSTPGFSIQDRRWRGRLVIPDGAGLQLVANGDPSGSANFSMSGYQLQLP